MSSSFFLRDVNEMGRKVSPDESKRLGLLSWSRRPRADSRVISKCMLFILPPFTHDALPIFGLRLGPLCFHSSTNLNNQKKIYVDVFKHYRGTKYISFV